MLESSILLLFPWERHLTLFPNGAEQSTCSGGSIQLKTCKPQKWMCCVGVVDIRRMPGSYERRKRSQFVNMLCLKVSIYFISLIQNALPWQIFNGLTLSATSTESKKRRVKLIAFMMNNHNVDLVHCNKWLVQTQIKHILLFSKDWYLYLSPKFCYILEVDKDIMFLTLFLILRILCTFGPLTGTPPRFMPFFTLSYWCTNFANCCCIYN